MGFRIGADDEQRRARPLLGSIGVRVRSRVHLVVEAAEVIKGDEDRRAAPIWALFYRADELAHPVVTFGHAQLVVTAITVGNATGRDNREGRKAALRSI